MRAKSITHLTPQKPEDPAHMSRNPHRLWQGWNRFFTPSQLKKCPELIPVVFVMFFSPTLTTLATRHILFNNPGFRIQNKSDQETGPGDYVAPTQCTKYYNSQPDVYKPIPEMEEVRKDLRDAAPQKENSRSC